MRLSSAGARASHVDEDPKRVNDREYVDSIYLEVKSAIQDAMDRLATQRRSRSSASSGR